MKRYISTSFWDDEWVQSLSFTEKALYLYLLTNPLTNIAGIYKIADRRIVFDTGLANDEVHRIMEKFEEAGKAFRHEEYIVLPSWPHHQKCQNANIQKGIHRILMDLDGEMITFLKNVHYKYPLEEFEGDDSEPEHHDQEPESFASSDSDMEKQLFLKLWRTTKDKKGFCIFQITATIEKPRDWNRFWKESKPTEEQIRTAFRNFADGIDRGVIMRQYIPATPDRFVLKGGISRYQTPVINKDSKSVEDGKDVLEGKMLLA